MLTDDEIDDNNLAIDEAKKAVEDLPISTVTESLLQAQASTSLEILRIMLDMQDCLTEMLVRLPPKYGDEGSVLH